jgi:hypothetical protein
MLKLIKILEAMEKIESRKTRRKWYEEECKYKRCNIFNLASIGNYNAWKNMNLEGKKMSMTLSTFDLFLVYLSYSRFVTKEISI